jgi:pSer/pThr/pTyr-binding forkhead associated (FHA) protein
MILESFLSEGNVVTGQPQQTWQKNLHVVNFDPELKSYVRLGRGTDNDIRVNDISVSRIHAFIRRNPTDGSFYIEDNTSKFGTLV